MGQFNLPLGSLALVNSDSDCRVFITVAPNVRSAYFAKSFNGAALVCKFVKIFKKCRACFRNRYGFNSCLSHGLHKIAHVRCPGKFIAFKLAAVVVKVEFVSPVGFKCSSAQFFCIVLSILSEVFKVGFNLFGPFDFTPFFVVFAWFPLRCVVYYRISRG